MVWRVTASARASRIARRHADATRAKTCRECGGRIIFYEVSVANDNRGPEPHSRLHDSVRVGSDPGGYGPHNTAHPDEMKLGVPGAMTSGPRLIAIGAVAGLFAWVYDYDFFLNAGGPAAPMSNAILAAAHLNDASALVIVSFPLVVMMAAGAGIGFVAKIVAEYVRQ